MSQTIKVVVRVRPMNTKQKDRNCNSIITADQQNNQISITKPDQSDNIKSFAFDYVFNQMSLQSTVYQKTAFKLVQNVIEGYNGTIFAYGQTGCGKTHSMVGKLQSQQLQGIIPRSFKHILNIVALGQNKQFLIRCSFIEIYNQQVHDLLSKDIKAKLDIKQNPEKGIFIKDLSMNPAKTLQQLMDYMECGNKNRSVGETLMNKDSSRSHSIFMLFIQSAQKMEKGQDRYVAGKLNLVDLAGSQRISKTGAAGQRLKQAQKINLSLSALGNVISALVDGKSQHIPYRDSKLTRLLQDSLGGNTKTVMIANCSPADYNFDETLSTLRYASRAKFIKNKPIINQDPKDALLKQYAQQIKRLKLLLQSGGNLPKNIEIVPNNKQEKPNDDSNNMTMINKLNQKEEQLLIQKNERKKLEQKIKMIEAQYLEAKDIHVEKNEIEILNRVREQITKQNIQQEKKNNVIDEQNEILQKYQNLQQQFDNYKKLYKKQKQKIKSLELELKDINEENYNDREILLDELRRMTKQNKFQSGLLNIMLSRDEIQIVKTSSEYNQEKQDYKIPLFHFKNKKISFPKLGENQILELIKQEKQNRQIIIDNNKLNEKNENFNILKQTITNKQPSQDNSQYSLHEVIKNARLNQNQKSSKKLLNKEQKIKLTYVNSSLEPIQNRMVKQENMEVKLIRKGQLEPLKK